MGVVWVVVVSIDAFTAPLPTVSCLWPAVGCPLQAILRPLLTFLQILFSEFAEIFVRMGNSWPGYLAQKTHVLLALYPSSVLLLSPGVQKTLDQVPPSTEKYFGGRKG